ncbi:hypothetical protein ACTXT7_005389 [Hymenolepis weldensis]
MQNFVDSELSTEEMDELKEAFALFDKDGNGSISRGELKHLMTSLGQNPTRENIKKMINEVDADGNGSIDFDEFLKLMKKKIDDCEPERELKEAFQVFDMNGDGYITRAELRRTMEGFGERVSRRESVEMIRHADIDGDGRNSSK